MNLAQAIRQVTADTIEWLTQDELGVHVPSVLAYELGRDPHNAYVAVGSSSTRPLGTTGKHCPPKQGVLARTQEEQDTIGRAFVEAARKALPWDLSFNQLCKQARVEPTSGNRKVLDDQVARGRVLVLGEGSKAMRFMGKKQ